ncbi:hypothetical protein PSTT_10455 [Puccinia striiformis]|uniref:Uncharacterized protein n=1 Tax=Puccinia striiformis TaxID=27350 RepID=A0A2S4V4I4_9BASI|nr:hypothetical protein PSTT_10455 [Puccinia striiformis]
MTVRACEETFTIMRVVHGVASSFSRKQESLRAEGYLDIREYTRCSEPLELPRMSLPILQESTTPPPGEIEDRDAPLPQTRTQDVGSWTDHEGDQLKDAPGDGPSKEEEYTPESSDIDDDDDENNSEVSDTQSDSQLSIGTLPIQDELPDPMTKDGSGNQVELSHHELSLRRAGLIDYAHQLIAQTSHKFFEDEHRIEELKKKIILKSDASRKIQPRLKRRDHLIQELFRIHKIELETLLLEVDNILNLHPIYSELTTIQKKNHSDRTPASQCTLCRQTESVYQG